MAKNGGMSFSNNFVVSFEDNGAFFNAEEVEYFCDEAQLPNVNTATGSQVGLYTGLGQIDYPHTRVFTDFQLSFLLDANLGLLKSLNFWYGTIFNETAVTGPVTGQEGILKENRVTRLAYPDEYVRTIKIRKTESGPESTTQRNPITYVMEKAYPYAIDAVPLQFGTSQVTRVTANFKYQRHYTIVDNNSVKDRALNPTIRTVRGGGTEVGVGTNDLRGSSSGIA